MPGHPRSPAVFRSGGDGVGVCLDTRRRNADVETPEPVEEMSVNLRAYLRSP